MSAPPSPPGSGDASPGAGAEARTQSADRVLRAIALYKFVKALVLAAAGLGAIRLLQPAAVAWAERWSAALALRHEGRVIQHLLALLVGMRPRRLEAVAIGAFLFATLFVIEGIGLWLRRRWAQYLTVVATTLFIPLEIFQLFRFATPARAATLAINLAVVLLLIRYLRLHGFQPRGA